MLKAVPKTFASTFLSVSLDFSYRKCIIKNKGGTENAKTRLYT